MVRSALVLATLFSAPAWAVGERIALVKGPAFVDQLRETLCISMECGVGTDATVSAKVIKGNRAEIKVFAPNGALKATVTAPLTGERLSSMDLVAATSGLIAGIEGQQPAQASASDAEPKAKPSKKKAFAAKSKKKGSVKLAAKPRSAHSRG